MKRTIRRIDKPWGYELIFAETEDYVGKVLHVDAGAALSLQYHREKDETLFLREGEVELEVDEGGELVRHRLRQGDAYRIVPGTRHRLIAGKAGCDVIEVSTPQLDDVVRLEDRYGRAKEG